MQIALMFCTKTRFETKIQDNSEMAYERHINAITKNPARDRLKTDGISGGFCGKDNKICDKAAGELRVESI